MVGHTRHEQRLLTALSGMLGEITEAQPEARKPVQVSEGERPAPPHADRETTRTAPAESQAEAQLVDEGWNGPMPSFLSFRAD